MHSLQVFVSALGRMGLSLIFILASVNKIMDWQGTEQSVVAALNTTSGYLLGWPFLQSFLHWGIGQPFALVLCAVIFELLGGLLVFLGIQVRFGAFLLLIFLIPTTFLFHHFWFLQGPDHDLQQIMFLKNLSIFGGLLIVLALGKGGSSSRSVKE